MKPNGNKLAIFCHARARNLTSVARSLGGEYHHHAGSYSYVLASNDSTQQAIDEIEGEDLSIVDARSCRNEPPLLDL